MTVCTIVFNQHFDAFRILTAFKWNTSLFQSFSQWGTGHVKLTTKSWQIIPAWRHFYALCESWARSIEYINSWGRSSKINRAVAIFNFNWWITDSPMQITIHEIRHFTLMTELLTFAIYFAFLCKPIWGNASVLRYYCNLLLFPLSWHLSGNSVRKKIFRGTAFPRVPRSPSATPLATAVIFKYINFNISATPTWPSSKSFEQTFEVISQ